METSFAADAELRAVIGRIGQTEDVQFSPAGRRLALAGLFKNRLLVLDSAAGFKAGEGPLRLTGYAELASSALIHPHGLSWIDEVTIAVASRGGGVAIFAIPQAGGRLRGRLEPIRIVGADPRDLIATPGSTSVRSLGMGLIELLVCNNSLHQVSRHILDQRNLYAPVASEVLLEYGFDVPDGIVHSPSGRWLAVSNHGHHCVFLYRNHGALGRASRPDGVLGGLQFPHGLAFSDDERSLVVADSATPGVVHFASEDGDWAGTREPDWALRAVSDDIFARGRLSIRDGGPKGIAITDGGRLMVTTCEERPLAFFDLGDLLARADGACDPTRDEDEAEILREAMLRLLSAKSAPMAEPSEVAAQLREREIHRLINSRSFRFTAPLRRAAESLRRRRHRAGL